MEYDWNVSPRMFCAPLVRPFLLGKLAAFYFFFYLALAGFFSLYLSIFMSFLPLNQPRCTGKASRLTSRANPLSPGLAS